MTEPSGRPLAQVRGIRPRNGPPDHRPGWRYAPTNCASGEAFRVPVFLGSGNAGHLAFIRLGRSSAAGSLAARGREAGAGKRKRICARPPDALVRDMHRQEKFDPALLGGDGIAGPVGQHDPRIRRHLACGLWPDRARTGEGGFRLSLVAVGAIKPGDASHPYVRKQAAKGKISSQSWQEASGSALSA